MELKPAALGDVVRERVNLAAGLGEREVLREGAAHVVHRGVVVHARGGVVVVAIVVVAVVAVCAFFFNGACAEDLNLAAEDHLEGLAADGLVDAGKARAVAPFVEFATESVGLELEKAELASSEQAMPARGVDVCNGRVDDGRLGGAADLGKVGEESSQILLEG